MNYSDSFTRGVKAAQNLLDRLGWQYDASCFATAPPAMREEAERVIFGPTEHEEEQGFRWYLGYCPGVQAGGLGAVLARLGY